MKITAAERIRRFYDQFASEDQVLILINADPDAIASAMAVKRLLWRKTAGVTIASINVIKRTDNIAMVRLLGVKLVHINDVDPTGYTRFVLVDSQPDHSPLLAGFAFDVIIDHHPDSGPTAAYMDIRPKYGANASILTEYLRAARIKPSAKLATGLFYAIKTDTSNFERPSQMEDIRAFQFLFRHANAALARRIDQADLRMDFLKYFRTAIAEKRFRKGQVFVHLGPVVSPDVCVLIADFFMRIDTVNWSVVSGIHDRKLIIVFRNDGIRKNAGRVAKFSFGCYGSAGGHKSMARAEIRIADLKEVVDVRSPDRLKRWIAQRIQKRTEKKAKRIANP
jgi:nanoRNase/pAp phosphatase (c-di-AMP/oligoRNAs hydrolase)